MADAPLRTRLHVEDDLAEGRTLGLDAQRTHYLRHVLRMDKGDAVGLFNGRHGEHVAVIDGFGKGWCSLAVGRQIRPQRDGADVWLLFAPIKRQRIDWLVEKASELGASALCPVFTRHTDVNRVNLDRLTLVAIEAAEQSERLTVPDLREAEPLEKVLARWPAGRTLFLCAESGDARPIAEAVAAAPPGPAAILVGPEGGFAKTELDDLNKLPFVVPVGLGPRILRADTAALAALACWQSRAGDWAAGSTDVRPAFRSAAPPAHPQSGHPNTGES